MAATMVSVADDERHRPFAWNTEHKAAHQAIDGEGSRSSRRSADRGQLQALQRDQPEHVATFCTERETERDFVRALRDGLREHAVDARHRQREREQDDRPRQINGESDFQNTATGVRLEKPSW